MRKKLNSVQAQFFPFFAEEGGACEGHPSHAPSVRIQIFKLIEKTMWTLSTSILFGFNTYNSGPEMHGKTLI
jgi:hypothetical protein